MEEVDRYAKILWDYQSIYDKPEKADCILVLGSHDLRVAERGAELFLRGLAPIVVMSGGFGRLTDKLWTKPEAEMFKDVAVAKGVPAECILTESNSTNTGENILFSKSLLEKHGIKPKKVLLVQKPYMGRRAFATFKNIWPEPELIVTAPHISYENYPNDHISKDEMINIIVGDMQRIRVYPDKGFQIPQDIPPYVMHAYQELVKMGYTKHLIKE